MMRCISRFAIFMAGFCILASAAAQSPGKAPSNRDALYRRSSQGYPAPTNLKALSRDLTRREVVDLMKQWSAELGVRCTACHLRESEGIASAGPQDNRFADDSKPMKQVARIMYTMTVNINRKFIASDDGGPGSVTCGTCHRGSIRPEPFASPPNPQQPEEGTASQ